MKTGERLRSLLPYVTTHVTLSELHEDVFTNQSQFKMKQAA